MSYFSRNAGPLRGIIVPMVTPLSEADELDVAGLERLVDRLLGGGVHGLFVLGTCGEGPSLSGRLQREVIDRTCRQTAGRVPVLVGATHPSAAETAALAAHAANAGADAIVTAAPFYFPLTQAELVDYIDRVAGASPLPVMLYNMPALTKVTFEPATVARLKDDRRIVGLKDSGGDMGYFRSVRAVTRDRDDWTLLVGPEHLLAESIEAGGDGGVSGAANVLPRLLVQLYEAARAGFPDELAAFESDVARLSHIYAVASPGGSTPASVVKGLKAALGLLGVCRPAVAPPLAPLDAGEREQVKQILQRLAAAETASLSNDLHVQTQQ